MKINCNDTTSAGNPCGGGAMTETGFCGPHTDKRLRKAKSFFEEHDNALYAQLAQAMLDREVEVDLDFLRTEARNHIN